MTTSTKSRPSRRRHRSKFLRALPFLAPALLAYVAFVIGPMVESVRLSFFEWTGFIGAPQKFVGFDNYIRIFTQDPVFWTAFRNTVIWIVLSLVVPLTISLLLAVALNRPLFGRNLFRTIFYIPSVLASIAVANMWRWIYNPNHGIGASFGEALGLPWLADIQWLGDQDIALYSVFIAFVWQVVGTNMVLFLAGLQSVLKDHVDAARIDGANGWQVFRHVTLPALRPTMVIVFVLTFIGAIKVFDLIVGMTGGGPAQMTQVLALWSYQQSIVNHEYGPGSAIATVLLVVTLAVVLPYLAWTGKQEDK